MRSRFMLLALLFVIPHAWLPAQQRPMRGERQRGGMRRGDQAAGEQGWIFSLEKGKAQARESGKPLMVMVRCVP
ncbi:MAG TPA: hypothetical protein VGY66_01360 [Gemmataceae bacterium]|nr:hypothetical protein [Gemmataceae bacterium]